MRSNVPMTFCAAVTVKVHAPVPVQVPPDQPTKYEPAAGTACNVTGVPTAKVPLVPVQPAPHERPDGVAMSAPPPAPARCTVTGSTSVESVSSSPAPLSSAYCSTVPAGAVARAVTLTSPVPTPGTTLAVRLQVTLLPAGMVAVASSAPLPEAAPHEAPAWAVHVHERPVSCAGALPTTRAPVAVDGPRFNTVMAQVFCCPHASEPVASSTLVTRSTYCVVPPVVTFVVTSGPVSAFSWFDSLKYHPWRISPVAVASARTVTFTVVDAPAASAPSVQLTVPRVPTVGVVQVTPAVSTERNVVPAGRYAVSLVPVDVDALPFSTR